AAGPGRDEDGGEVTDKDYRHKFQERACHLDRRSAIRRTSRHQDGWNAGYSAGKTHGRKKHTGCAQVRKDGADGSQKSGRRDGHDIVAHSAVVPITESFMFRRVCSSRFIIAVSLVSLLAGMFGTSNTPAQTTSGTIVGYVKDKAGKGIPEALVTITNEENKRNRAALTDENGYYVRVNLPPGTYKLAASKAGYVDQVVANFPVQFNQKNLVKAPEFTLPKVTLRGNVVDRVDNSLPGARVVAANEQSGEASEAVTGERGDYSIPELDPGKYRIHASWSGGQAVSIAVALEREEERAPSIKLIDALSDSHNPSQSPAPAQSANGEEVAALVRTNDIARANNFTEQQVQSLPLGGTTYMRTFDELALLVAGVAPPPYTPGARGPGVGFGVGTAGQFSVNGMRARSNNFSVDGSDNNDPDVGVRRQGFVALVPQSIESI